MNRRNLAARIAWIGPIACGCVLLGACQAGHTYVLDAPRIADPVSCDGLSVRPAAAQSAEVDDEQTRAFEDALVGALVAARPAADEAQGGGETTAGAGAGTVTLEYRVVLHEKGNAPMRFGAFIVSLVGIPVNNAGEGDVGVEVAYLDDRGARVAHIVVDGPIDGPISGSHTGLGTAAEQIAAFTRERFRYATVEATRRDSQ